MGSFSTSLSGLDAEQQALSVISNDLSNLNTTAFKSGTPIFSDLFYQMLGTDGDGDPVQVGVGATMGSVDSPFTQGDVSSTGVPTDVAIEGNGLFVLDQDGTQVYTRAGNFTLNSAGYLVDSNGNNVMGYPAVNGTISSSQSLAPIQIASGQTYPPNATSSVQLDMNLNATGAPVAATGILTLTGNADNGETVAVGGTTYTFVTALSTDPTVPDQVLIGTAASDTLNNLAAAVNGTAADEGTTYSTGTVGNTKVTAAASGSTLTLTASTTGTSGDSIATTTDMADGSFASSTLTGGNAGGSFSTPIAVYDSLGNSHTLTFNFSQTSSGNWTYQITIPAADVGSTGNPQVVASGTLQFNSSGNLVSPSTNVTGISVSGLADGAKAISFDWQLFNSSGSSVITQTAEPSATSGEVQNGYGAGTLQSYSINSNGIIDGVLSNGQTLALGQIALATFPNYDGLTNLGSNDYQASLASGAASISAPGTGGSGTLEGDSLEASNVDIATAFTQLIEAQSGYEANAKAITTADTVEQAVIALIQPT
ncbi:MAG: flagellar hook protein FlgE [Terriglobia bacterium]